MKKYVRTSSALLFAMLICLTTTHATTHTTTAQDAPPKQMAKVVTVDTAKSELAVKDEKGMEKTMSIAPTTKITKEGKDITLAEIKTGDRVMYELDATSDPPVAKSLLVMSVKSAKP
jgi:hypothetical protein